MGILKVKELQSSNGDTVLGVNDDGSVTITSQYNPGNVVLGTWDQNTRPATDLIPGYVGYNLEEKRFEVMTGFDDRGDPIWYGVDTRVKFSGVNEVTYSWYETFSSGQSPSLSTASAFATWLGYLENPPNGGTIKSISSQFSQGSTYTITDSNYIQNLRNAISSGNSYGSGTSTNWWFGWNCQSGSSLNYLFTRNGNHSPTFVYNGTGSCSCGYRQIRPLINNSNWGGWNSGCGQGTQQMGMSMVVEE